MPFANGPETEDEAQAAFRRVGLVGMGHDAGVEQGRGLERIFVEKIGADQLALGLGEGAMSRQRLFHHIGARFERLQQVAVAAVEILQDVFELAGNGFGVERENPVDDMVGPRLVGRVEIARFRRRLERAHDHPRRVGTQIKRLTVEEGGSRRQGASARWSEMGGQVQVPTARSAAGGVWLVLTRASCLISARLRR